MSIETMKLALEALEYPLNQTHENFNVDMAELLSHRAIESLRQAIEQANVATNDTSQERVDEIQEHQYEPVAWIWKYNDGDEEATLLDPKYFSMATLDIASTTPLYTSPPQRQPLTDEEIRKAKHHMVEGAYHYSFQQGVRYAEAAHGITGEQK